MKRWVLVLMVVLLAGFACEDDDPVKPDPVPQQTYQNLTQRWHVLNNLELAYSQRNFSRFGELLDNDFEFILDEGDVGGGVPAQWDLATELEIALLMFDEDLNDPNYPRVTRIDFDLYEETAVTWADTVVSGETWSIASVFYDFQFDIEPDLTLIPFLGSKAHFLVRNIGTEDAPEWRLATCRDLGAANRVAASASATSQSTWGAVKSLYLPADPVAIP